MGENGYDGIPLRVAALSVLFLFFSATTTMIITLSNNQNAFHVLAFFSVPSIFDRYTQYSGSTPFLHGCYHFLTSDAQADSTQSSWPGRAQANPLYVIIYLSAATP